MLPGGRYVKFTPKLVIPKWVPRGCLIRSFMSDARGSGNVSTGALAGADTASTAAVEKSVGIATPPALAITAHAASESGGSSFHCAVQALAEAGTTAVIGARRLVPAAERCLAEGRPDQSTK